MRNIIPFILIFYLVCVISLYAQKDLWNNHSKFLSDTNKIGMLDLKSDPEVQRLSELKSNLTTAQQKFSTDLLQLVNSEFLPQATSLEQHSETMKSLNQFKPFEQAANFEESIREGVVYVYINLKRGNSTSIINDLVEKVTDRDEKNNMAVAWIKVKNLEALSLFDTVRSIRTVMPPNIRTGSVTTEGDDIHRTLNVRSIYGENGTGIKVGIISDGVDSRSSAIASGDLPSEGSGLTVRSNTYGGDEGTAMLEIVYDMVPGAELYFHDLGGNTVAFNSAIDDLVTAGCDIICDDIGWLLEPFYEDGTVASHISSVITNNDIIYISSAGNSGDSHYQGDFYSWSGNPNYHDFNGALTDPPFLYVNMPTLSNVIVILQWDEEFGSSGNDYNLYLYRIDGGLNLVQLVATSNSIQNGNDDPLEYFSYTRLVGASNFAVVVENLSGNNNNIEVFIYPDGSSYNYTNNIKAQDAIYGHPAVNGVVAVGAVDQATPTSIEAFSSKGPSTIAFPSSEIRQKPNIVGVDFVSVTGAGGFPTSFGGTSAAAPHIVSILAQAWSYDLGQTGDDVRQLLYDWPVDLGNPGYDNTFGYGRGDALNIFNGALPVELSSFSASVLDNLIKLSWRTETEVNNYGFEILRQAQDDKEWRKIGFVNGNGNSNSPKNYSFSDKNFLSGKYSYRLKQIDSDGQYEYSKTIEVDLGVPKKFELSQNYPNPFNPSTTIRYSLPEAGNVRLTLFNILGQEIKTLINEVKESGVHTVNFNASELNSGLYIYKIEANGFTQTRKMILIK